MSHPPAAKRRSRMPTNGRHRDAARSVLDGRESEGQCARGRRQSVSQNERRFQNESIMNNGKNDIPIEPMLLRIRDAATMLSVSERSIWQLLRAGELRAIHPP